MTGRVIAWPQAKTRFIRNDDLDDDAPSASASNCLSSTMVICFYIWHLALLMAIYAPGPCPYRTARASPLVTSRLQPVHSTLEPRVKSNPKCNMD